MAGSKRKSRALALVASSSRSPLSFAIDDPNNNTNSTTTTAQTAERKQWRWEVDFSRFYPVSRQKNVKARDTWLRSSTKASLSFSAVADSAHSSVHVLIGPDLIEEHFVYDLHYSWPQISCIPQCPIRGSRVIFMSYSDFSSQIQKFAVRFPGYSDAEEFLNCVKERLKEKQDITFMPLSSDFTYEETKFKYQYPRKARGSGNEVSIYEDPMLSHPIPLEENINSIFSAFPPSFTDLLASCSTDTLKREQSNQTAGTSLLTSQTVGYTVGPMDSYSQVAESKMSEAQEADLASQIAKYLSDEHFQAMLFDVEKLVEGLGENFAF